MYINCEECGTAVMTANDDRVQCPCAYKRQAKKLKREIEHLKEVLTKELIDTDLGNEYTYVMALKDRVVELQFLLEGARK